MVHPAAAMEVLETVDLAVSEILAVLAALLVVREPVMKKTDIYVRQAIM